ncbi:sigma-70 family RNA polymerase sigma factor [Actinomadura craniellae]|uniref:sigma-70 family RNA polymerase sigma factor n=1 Tax=Actinomadura craniellae TaxID=2231787 RepID=UPI0018F11FF4|nr:sigma-70 family RNA polymerase sigma factor [Actinomadura craniellae]
MPPDEPAEDELWLGRLAAGDERVLGELYDLFGRLVYGVALRVTRNREAAEDVTQEVFTFIWERPLAFDPGKGTMRSWLGLLAHRRAVEYVRAEERRRRALQAVEAPPPDPDIAEEVAAAEVGGRVQSAVEALPAALREVVELAYFKGRSYRQAAEDLGLAEGTAKSRIRIALRRMADALAEEGLSP